MFKKKYNYNRVTFHCGRMTVKNHWALIIIARIEERFARIFDRIHYILSVIKWGKNDNGR